MGHNIIVHLPFGCVQPACSRLFRLHQVSSWLGLPPLLVLSMCLQSYLFKLLSPPQLPAQVPECGLMCSSLGMGIVLPMVCICPCPKAYTVHCYWVDKKLCAVFHFGQRLAGVCGLDGPSNLTVNFISGHVECSSWSAVVILPVSCSLPMAYWTNTVQHDGNC